MSGSAVMAHHLDLLFAAIDDAIAEDHQRELRAFAACHDAEAGIWAGEVSLLQTVRQILERGSLDAWAHRA